ncbi:Fungal specific transcription factor domain-containing protein [Cladophialophora immunda]|nr:Fungal specific transcription factor domain-containing protein [Cladophialophora immunda]
MIPAQGSEGGTALTTIHHSHDNLDQLAMLSSEFEPYTVQRPPSYSSASEIAGNLYSGPGIASGHSNHALPSADDAEQSGSYGTLMLSKGGRSKYLGPTAGSEWLKDSETQDVSDTPLVTRASSPEPPQAAVHVQSAASAFGTAPIAFPFNTSTARISTRDLLSHLPPREEAWILVESYYRYCAWHHDVAPKTRFQKTFDRVYNLSEGASSSPVNPQEIALVYIILAQGTMFNIEMPNYDPSVEDWLHLSERALVKGRFLSNNMVAGLQTLHLMAHLHLHLDKGRCGDNAWPLWGLVMRLIQAMGMHRDGARWNLPEDVVEERRKVFWECNAADTFQAHCFSRPCAINPEHCDTAFPSEALNLNGEKSYSLLRFELSQLSSEILNMAMKVRKPAYSDVIDLDLRLCEFERNLPFSLRCRAALLSMPSRYPQSETAIAASPEPSRRSMTISFQQTNLALNISETIINLHRPYYAKALYDDVDDRVKSVHAPSFLTVIERCAIIIAMVTDIHARFPAVSIRQWNFWYHVFGSALCLGTLVLRDPSNSMANFVLAQIDAAIDLFTSLTQLGTNTPRYHRNLQWLVKLRARASSKISRASTAQKANAERGADPDVRRSSEDREDGEDVELLGWRTRLIERAGQDRLTIRTIRFAATPTGSHITDISGHPPDNRQPVGPQGQPRTAEMMMPSASLPFLTPDPTDDLLRDFWDPMLLQDIFGSSHDQANLFGNNGSAWWEADATAAESTQARP